jgi:ferric-dicitrate binding protein FerR (iron transport regulator)
MIRNPKFDDSGRLQSADPVAQAAAEWVVRRDRGLNAEEVRTLAEWLDADPRHSGEFARIANSWQRLDVIGAVPGLVAMADAIEMRARTRRQRQRTWAAAAGVAVAASIVATFGLWRSVRSSGPAEPKKGDYIVLASTARHMAMPDGSVAELNGDSRIVMDFSPTERRVKLVHGEAHFSVAKNPARPFIVSAGSVAVRAVGTAFDVRIAADSVEVLVTEGKVHLQESAHASGQQPLPEKSLDSVSTGRALSAGERAVVQIWRPRVRSTERWLGKAHSSHSTARRSTKLWQYLTISIRANWCWQTLICAGSHCLAYFAPTILTRLSICCAPAWMWSPNPKTMAASSCERRLDCVSATGICAGRVRACHQARSRAKDFQRKP